MAKIPRGKTETIKQRSLYIYLPSVEMVEDWKKRAAKSSEEAVELQDIESHFSELIKSYEGRKKIVDAVFVGGSIASSFVGATFLPIMALTAAASLDEVVRILCGRRPIGRSLVKIAEPRGLRSFFDIYEGTKNQAA